jgi:limonene 1,2-monooxygenase
MHIAESREQARRDMEYGLRHWVDYYQTIGTLPMVPPERLDDPVGHLIESGMAVIGTPDEAVQQIEMLWNASGGGFGSYLICDLNWAPFEAKLKSYELFARYVMPVIKDMNRQRFVQHDWIKAEHQGFKSSQEAAMQAQFAKLAEMQAGIAERGA